MVLPKRSCIICVLLVLCLEMCAAYAQWAPKSNDGQDKKAVEALFGKNPTFRATVQVEVETDTNGSPFMESGEMFFNKSVLYLVSPDARSFAKLRLSKVTITPVGKDTIAGHPCIKSKAIVIVGKGQKYALTIWNASDLRNVPVKVRLKVASTTVTVAFKNIRFPHSGAIPLKPPVGCTRYNSVQEMIQEMVQGAVDMGSFNDVY